MEKILLTEEGANRLREELNQLQNEERQKITDAIAEAREHGDLKENAEYHAAREQQGFVEARIKYLSDQLGNAQMIDITKIENTGKVIFGTTVTLFDLEKESEVTYQIVGDSESNVNEGKISLKTPMALAMMGKSVGDEVELKLPAGVTHFEVVKVEHI